jgi:cytochrome c biogenesis protein CcmG/thiol:disulfide interchange protein DsbE
VAKYLPLTVFVLLVLLCALPLLKGKDPSVIPSALIGRHAPKTILPPTAFGHGPVLVNIFASWCLSCVEEQKTLMSLKNQNITIYGIAYKDKEEPLQKWLVKNSNPYKLIVHDKEGRAGIEWGITGVPETFVVDEGGIVRYRYAGPVTEDVFKQVLAPLMTEGRK